MGADLLTCAVSLIRDIESALPELAFSSQVEFSPEDRHPRSVSWIVEGASRMSQVVLWEDGQSETELADVASGQITSEHLRIEEEPSLTELVNRVKSWLLGGSAG